MWCLNLIWFFRAPDYPVRKQYGLFYIHRFRPGTWCGGPVSTGFGKCTASPWCWTPFFYLKVRPKILVELNFQKQRVLDYWESGMDILRSRDMFKSFIKYQGQMQRVFKEREREYGFTQRPKKPSRSSSQNRKRLKKVSTMGSLVRKLRNLV